MHKYSKKETFDIYLVSDSWSRLCTVNQGQANFLT